VMDRSTLLVTDYANGFFTVDPASGKTTALAAPKDTTLLGVDGIVPVPGGLVATQNGVTPKRVIRVTLNPDLAAVASVCVLAAALPNLSDLSLITVMNGRPTFIAGSGWEGFDATKMKQPRAHTVRIFQVALP